MIDFDLLKNIMAVAAAVVSLFTLGVLNTLKQTISAQKEYITTLEQKNDSLKEENQEQDKRYHELQLQLSTVEGRLDAIRDVPLQTIADSIKTILENQQRIIQNNVLPERRIQQ